MWRFALECLDELSTHQDHWFAQGDTAVGTSSTDRAWPQLTANQADRSLKQPCQQGTSSLPDPQTRSRDPCGPNLASLGWLRGGRARDREREREKEKEREREKEKESEREKER